MLGRVPAGQAVLRSGARPGDLVLVSGQIGDGWLGLQVALGRVKNVGQPNAKSVLARYRTPEPRLVLCEALRAGAHAAADVSDGLIADAGHIARASDVAIELDLACVPLSTAGRDYIARSADRAQALLRLATGGDDYELVLTLAADDAPAMIAEAARRGLALTVIGQVVQGQGVRVVLEGREIPVIEPGYRHS
jgi:thiamine-monophosphate kinase